VETVQETNTEISETNLTSEITSKDNQHVKLASSLHEKKYRKEKNLVLFEGKIIIEEALKRKVKLQTLFYNKESFINDLKENYAKELENCEILQLSPELMQKVSTTESAAPLVAISEKPNFADPLHNDSQLSLLESQSPDKKTGNLFIYCENIQDPGNLGSIIRTAFSAGVQAVYLSHDCADIYNPKTLRSSMGTMFCGPVIYKDLQDLKTNMKSFSSQNETSYEIIGTSSHAEVSFDEININPMKNFLLLVGNESKGLREESLKATTMNVRINLENDIESLNVLSATSVVLFELRRKLK
jgi:TrmH family RNA methyltransferase